MEQPGVAAGTQVLRRALRLLLLPAAALVWWLLLSGGAAQASDTGHGDAPAPTQLTNTVRDATGSLTDQVGSTTATLTRAARHTTASAPEPVRAAAEVTATTVDTVVGTSTITITGAVAQTTGVVDVVTAPVVGTSGTHASDRTLRPTRQRVSPARHANSPHSLARRAFRATDDRGPVLRSAVAELSPAPRSPEAPDLPASPVVPAAPTMSAAGPVADLAGLALALPLVIRRSRLRRADVMPAGPTFGPDSSPD